MFGCRRDHCDVTSRGQVVQGGMESGDAWLGNWGTFGISVLLSCPEKKMSRAGFWYLKETWPNCPVFSWDSNASETPKKRKYKGISETHPTWGCKKWATFVAEKNEIGCQQELCGWKMPQKRWCRLGLGSLNHGRHLDSRAFITLCEHLVEIDMLYYSSAPPWSGSSSRTLPLECHTQVLAHTKCSINDPSFSKQMRGWWMNWVGGQVKGEWMHGQINGWTDGQVGSIEIMHSS